MSIVKLNNRGVRSATTFGSISALGEMRFIKKQTASSSATISFVDGTSDVVLDDTYKEYLFTFNNMHPATDNVQFSFQGSTDGGSSYGVTFTSTFFRAYNYEGGTDAALEYDASEDLAQSTSFQILSSQCGNDNDQSASGELWLFNPSSTTYVKHYMTRTQNYNGSDITTDAYTAGYINDTNDIDAIKFLFSSGSIDAGTFKLYGIKDS